MGVTGNEPTDLGVDRVRAALVALFRTPDGARDAPGLVCRGCVDLLPVDGASIAIAGERSGLEMLYATDETATRIDSLQDTLGEGPGLEAFAYRRPVLIADLAGDTAEPWPVFGSEIAGSAVGALFAFPLQRGAATLGVLSMYRRTSGWLTPQELATGLQLMDLATLVLLGLAPDGYADRPLVRLPPHREAVHQATGMVIAEFGIPVAEALARLRGYAFAAGTTVEEVSGDLTARRIHPRVIVE